MAKSPDTEEAKARTKAAAEAAKNKKITPADRVLDAYVSDEVKAARKKRLKDEADARDAAAKTGTTGTTGTTAKTGQLTQAQKYADELARLKLQTEYDKIDAAAAKVITDNAATAQEKQDAKDERARKFASLNEVAKLYEKQSADTYATDTADINSLYSGQESKVKSGRADSLDSLLKAVTASRGQIGDAEKQFLSSLVAPTAYSNVPLVDLSQSAQPNPLMGNLASEGASTAPVTAQSALDAQLAGQYAQMARNTATQLNTGNQNYMTALRNAGTGAAAAGQQQLATGQNAYTNQINAKYDDLANQLAMQRMQAIQQANSDRNRSALQAATYRADAAQYGETPVATPTTPVATPTTDPATFDPIQNLPDFNDTPVYPTIPLDQLNERRGYNQPLTPEEIARRKKALQSAASANLLQYD